MRDTLTVSLLFILNPGPAFTLCGTRRVPLHPPVNRDTLIFANDDRSFGRMSREVKKCTKCVCVSDRFSSLFFSFSLALSLPSSALIFLNIRQAARVAVRRRLGTRKLRRENPPACLPSSAITRNVSSDSGVDR